MSTLDQVRHGAHHAIEALAEGWHALRQRAAHAMTHFVAPEDLALPGVARWALLAAEVREEADRIVVTLEAPGMRAEDFEIEVVDGVLVVRGEKQREIEGTGGGRYFLLERAYGAFERAIHLPAEIDPARTEADYRRGVLSISLPKRDPHRAHRVSIEVS